MVIVNRPKTAGRWRLAPAGCGQHDKGSGVTVALMAAFSLKNAPITSDRQAVLLNDRNPLSVTDLSNTIAGVSDIAQISDGQRPKSIDNRNAIPKRSVFIHAEPETHMGVRGLAPKPVGRKEIPCKYLQSFKGNR